MPTPVGHLTGLKKPWLHRLEKLGQRRIRQGRLLDYELAETVCELALGIKRDISLLIDFQGRIEQVVVTEPGESLDQITQVSLPARNDGMAKRYCLRTQLGWHPPGAFDQVTLLQFRFPVLGILMAGLSPKHAGGFSRQFGEHPQFCDGVYLMHPVLQSAEASGNGATLIRATQTDELMTARQASDSPLSQWLEWAEPVLAQAHGHGTTNQERALLIGVYAGGATAELALQDSLQELAQLARSAGAVVIDSLSQARAHPDPHSYIGTGKAEEAALLIQQQHIDVVIADDELSPAQQRTLERLLRVKVIDRTELILDIFAQRAQSREGKIQVELAQLHYEMPRLKGRGRMFSQQTAVGAKGGIATRGPGETKLETDRRILRDRVAMLEQQAQDVVRHRQFQRQGRHQGQRPLIALVGYTNAGKSTLLRKLTQADVLVEDRLFATLDPTIRKLYLGSDPQTGKPSEVLLSDTVGFIRKLPTFLIKAFRGTLEEAAEAHLLWHVWDASHPERDQQAQSVHDILHTLFEELDITAPPMWLLCNKMDRLTSEQEAELMQQLALESTQPAFALSAQTGAGLDALLEATQRLHQDSQSARCRVTDVPAAE